MTKQHMKPGRLQAVMLVLLLSLLGACSSSSITMGIEVDSMVSTEVIAQGSSPSVKITNQGKALVEVSGPEKGEQARTLSGGQSVTRNGPSPLRVHLSTTSTTPIEVKVAARGVHTLATSKIADPQ